MGQGQMPRRKKIQLSRDLNKDGKTLQDEEEHRKRLSIKRTGLRETERGPRSEASNKNMWLQGGQRINCRLLYGFGALAEELQKATEESVVVGLLERWKGAEPAA